MGGAARHSKEYRKANDVNAKGREEGGLGAKDANELWQQCRTDGRDFQAVVAELVANAMPIKPSEMQMDSGTERTNFVPDLSDYSIDFDSHNPFRDHTDADLPADDDEARAEASEKFTDVEERLEEAELRQLLGGEHDFSNVLG